MLSNLSIKAKIGALLAVATLALLVVVLISFKGLQNNQQMLHEVGEVRMPSVQGLQLIIEAQTGIRSYDRAIDARAAYPDEAQEIQELLNQKKDAWAQVEKGWAIYAPLPQTEEEAVIWKQFEQDWNAWKASNEKLSEQAQAILRTPPELRAELFTGFHRSLVASRPLFSAAEQGLDKLIDLNLKIGDEAVAEANQGAETALLSMYIVGGVALVLLVLLVLLGTGLLLLFWR